MKKNTLTFYNKIYHSLFRDNKFNSKKKSWHGPPSLNLFEKFTRKNKDIKINKVLDVGCAWGRTLGYWKKKNIKAVGIDVSMEVVDYCNKLGYECYLASATDLSIFPDKIFDLYVSTDVYEHLREIDMIYAIKEAMRVTNKYLLIQPHPGPDKTGKLHLTIWSLKKWKMFFNDNNLNILSMGKIRKYKNSFLMEIKK